MLSFRSFGNHGSSLLNSAGKAGGARMVLLLLPLVVASCASPQMSTVTVEGPSRVEGWDGVNNLFRGDRIYFAGQPDEASLERLTREAGVTTVINLRHSDEQRGLSFEEPATAETLGLAYVNIPVSPASFSADDVDRFAAVFEQSDEPVLLHCASSNRVGGMWASYLVRHKGVDVDRAIEIGKEAGLRSESMINAVKRVAAN